MKIIHSRPRRWIVFPSASHAVYEHDDGYTKTICGLLLKGGEVQTTSEYRKLPHVCVQCRKAIVSQEHNNEIKDLK